MAARRTRADVERELESLKSELEGLGSDDEVWIREGDREFRVTGDKATKILGRFSDLWDDAGDGGEGEGGEGEGGDPPADPPAAKDGGYGFGRQRGK